MTVGSEFELSSLGLDVGWVGSGVVAIDLRAVYVAVVVRITNVLDCTLGLTEATVALLADAARAREAGTRNMVRVIVRDREEIEKLVGLVEIWVEKERKERVRVCSGLPGLMLQAARSPTTGCDLA